MINLIKVENECIGCPPELGCIGSACRYSKVTRYYCDECGDEKKLFYYDDRELCLSCIEDLLIVVEGSEY